MRRLTCLLATLALFSCPCQMECQSGNTAKENHSLPSPIRLLPGYHAEIVSGWEGGAGGKFTKQGGPSIDFQMSLHTESAVESIDKAQVVWREEQTVNGQHVVCVYTRSRELVITFPSFVANFRTKIRNEQDLAETLLMVLTFDPFHGYSTDPKDNQTSAPNSK